MKCSCFVCVSVVAVFRMNCLPSSFRNYIVEVPSVSDVPVYVYEGVDDTCDGSSGTASTSKILSEDYAGGYLTIPGEIADTPTWPGGAYAADV